MFVCSGGGWPVHNLHSLHIRLSRRSDCVDRTLGANCTPLAAQSKSQSHARAELGLLGHRPPHMKCVPNQTNTAIYWYECEEYYQRRRLNCSLTLPPLNPVYSLTTSTPMTTHPEAICLIPPFPSKRSPCYIPHRKPAREVIIW